MANQVAVHKAWLVSPGLDTASAKCPILLENHRSDL